MRGEGEECEEGVFVYGSFIKEGGGGGGGVGGESTTARENESQRERARDKWREIVREWRNNLIKLYFIGIVDLNT